MADPKGENSPEHIEELLSQLKGIFGHLSDSEQEEAKKKITPPPAAATPPPTPAPAPKPVPAPEPAPAPAPKPTPAPEPAPAPKPVPPPEPAPVPPPEKKSEPIVAQPKAAPMQDPFGGKDNPLTPLPEPEVGIPLERWVPPEGETAPATSANFKANEVIVPPGASLIPAAILYPAGRDNEAKIVVEKVERITPKFTKVAVVINIHALAPYDLKSDLKTAILSQLRNPQVKAVYVIVEKLLDDARRKAILAELEPRGVYFQEIPVAQIEKKALYTDMLLGMVFFFDSQKPAGEAPAA